MLCSFNMALDLCGLPVTRCLLKCFLVVFFWNQVMILGTESAEIVHLNYTSGDVTDNPLPDDVEVTITTDNDTTAVLHLKRVPEAGANIPVASIQVDSRGRYFLRNVYLNERKNIGYYQDPSHEAVIQITRTNDLGESTAQLKLEGTLHVSGSKHSILPEDHPRYRRDNSAVNFSSSSSDDGLYVLETVNQKPAVGNDFLEAPPEIRFSVPQSSFINPSLTPHGAESDTSPETPLTSTAPGQSVGSNGRRRRQAKTNIFIDVVAVVDYAVYRRFMADVGGARDRAILSIQEYYAFIFNGVDLRYEGITTSKYRLIVRLNQIVICETPEAAYFTERNKQADKPWDVVNAQSALTNFKDYVNAQKFPSADHAMLFTGYDIVSINGGKSVNTTTGLAYTSTVCRTDGTDVSIVEDLGGFQAVDTASHELAHGMGASHDGDNNKCASTDRYIMAGASFKETDDNRLNPWKFSTCSITFMENFIDGILTTTRGQQCLLQKSEILKSVPDISGRMPGREFSPDRQCQMMYGNTSRMCRGIEFGNTTTICTTMYCYDPYTESMCFEQAAAQGTTCGNEKECLSGECVYVPGAPTADDENCVFGDQPGKAFEGKTCKDFIGNYNGYCYQDVVVGRCCDTCKKMYRPIQGCEYGDKAFGCSQDICKWGSPGDIQKCCATCKQGNPIPPTTPGTTRSTTRGTTTTTTLRSPLLLVVTPAPGSGITITATSTVCYDDTQILVNNMSCNTASIMNPEYCYQAEMQNVCCASCRRANSGILGCEYGDRFPYTCRSLSSCYGYAANCCKTCAEPSSSPPLSSQAFVLIVLSLLTFISTLVMS